MPCPRAVVDLHLRMLSFAPFAWRCSQGGAQIGNQKAARCHVWNHIILRPTSSGPKGIDWLNLTSEHGIYRQHVQQTSEPDALPPEVLLARLEQKPT